MDLKSEFSALESVEDNEVITPQKWGQIEEAKIENNGYYDNQQENDDNSVNDSEGNVMETVNSPSSSVRSPGGLIGSSPPAKGYGLKKWRRIKRDINKDWSDIVDTSKLLKRGLSSSVANSTKPRSSSFEIKQKSEGSVSSTNGMVRNHLDPVDGFLTNGSNLDPSVAIEPNFSANTDSENSEDRSSKSSTAASVPKSRYEIPMMVGYARDQNIMTGSSGKTWGNSIQRGQQGKGGIETSKKARGERVKIEQENSHSSMESDSRSSNFVFVQGTNHVASNGNGRSRNYDGENSDEAHDDEQRFSEDLRDSNGKENRGEFEDLSQDVTTDLSWVGKQEKNENRKSSTDSDPLVESILTLQSAQEALEKEVDKLREIGEEQVSLFDDSTQASTSFPDFASANTNILEKQNSSDSLETQVITLKQNIDLLESKLEESRAALDAKETKVIELETTLESEKSLNQEMGSSLELQQKIYSEMETELESLFQQKIEAEVEYLVILRTIKLFEEQKTLALGRGQLLSKLGYAKSKAVMIEKQAEKLVTYSEDLVEADEVLKLQNRVCKVSSCLFIQLIFLVFVFVGFVLQLSPHYPGVVPT